jgi:hypothetical protein
VAGRVAGGAASRLRCEVVDPHRNFPDEADPRWYPTERGAPDPDWDRRGAHYDDEPAYGDADRYRVSDPRGARGGYDVDPGPPAGPRYGETAPARPATIGPRSGEPLPPRPADVPDEAPRHLTETIDRAALRRGSGGPDQVGAGVYRGRRPGLAVGLIVVTVVFELVQLRMLAVAALTRLSAGGAIASSFALLGLPLFALGLYGLLTGAAAVPGAPPARLWLKAPLVYLPVGLVLFVAAGLAAS